MTRRTRSATILQRLCALSALALTSCAVESPGVDPDLLVGKYLSVYFENEPIAFCLGSAAHLDRYIEATFALLDEPIPPDFRAYVYVVDDATSICGGPACYGREDGVSYIEYNILAAMWARPLGILRYPVTEGIILRTWGPSIPFFIIGLTEMLSRSSIQTLDPWPGIGFDSEFATTEELSLLAYVVAPRFIRFLIDTQGLPKFRRLFTGDWTRMPGQLMDDFASIYGRDMQDIVTEFADGSPRCAYQLELCDTTVPEALGERWTPVIANDCADPDIVGTDIGIRAWQKKFSIAEPGRYMLNNFSMILHRCGDCSQQFSYTHSSWLMSNGAVLELEAGEYVVELTSIAFNGVSSSGVLEPSIVRLDGF